MADYQDPQIVYGNTAPTDDPRTLSGAGAQVSNAPTLYVFNQKLYDFQDPMIRFALSGNNTMAAAQAQFFAAQPRAYGQQENYSLQSTAGGGSFSIANFIKNFFFPNNQGDK